MQKYGEFSPTPFDPKGIVLDDQQGWLVVGGRNRDSGILPESNFQAALDMLGGESDTVQVHRFGHWACGWLEIIIVDPESPEADTARDIESALSDYPVLDDEDHSRREYEAALDWIRDESPDMDYSPDGWESEVFSWLWENEQSELENPDDTGATPDPEYIREACIALGYVLPDEDDPDPRETQPRDCAGQRMIFA